MLIYFLFSSLIFFVFFSKFLFSYCSWSCSTTKNTSTCGVVIDRCRGWENWVWYYSVTPAHKCHAHDVYCLKYVAWQHITATSTLMPIFLLYSWLCCAMAVCTHVLCKGPGQCTWTVQYRPDMTSPASQAAVLCTHLLDTACDFTLVSWSARFWKVYRMYIVDAAQPIRALELFWKLCWNRQTNQHTYS